LFSDGYVEGLLKEKDPEIARFYTEEDYKSWREISREEKNRFIAIAKEYLSNLAKTSEWKKFSKVDYRRELIEKQEKFEDLGPDAIGACESEFSWLRWIGDNGYEFFGDDYYEFGDIGRTISLRVQSHLIGLKMIREGILAGKYMNPSTRCPWLKFSNWFRGKFKKITKIRGPRLNFLRKSR